MKEGAMVQQVCVIGELDLVREAGKGVSKEVTTDLAAEGWIGGYQTRKNG